MRTYLWYDYETFGKNTKIDRISQFAGIRTDENFNIINKIEYFCKLANDYIPNYEACLITNISPQRANKDGISEEKLANEIYKEFNKEGTVSTGYNSLKFDDEVTRNLFYRTLRDPYTREWKNNCNRWDFMKVILGFYLEDREKLNWPIIDGKPSFKLEKLTEENGIKHANAHDALSDVEATINLAKKTWTLNPNLYNYIFDLKNKNKVLEIIRKNQIFIHGDFSYSYENGYCSVLYKVSSIKRNANEFIFLDLNSSLEIIKEKEVEELRELMYMKKKDLEKKEEQRPGIKIIKTNQIPLLFSWDEFKNKEIFDLNFLKNQSKIAKEIDIKYGHKILKLLDMKQEFSKNDVEQDIYNGFPSPNDKSQFLLIHQDPKNYKPNFEDKKYYELHFRWMAKNHFDFLDTKDKLKWKNYCFDVLNGNIEREGNLTFNSFEEEILKVKKEYNSDSKEIKIIEQLEKYVQKLKKEVCKSHKNKKIENLTLF